MKKISNIELDYQKGVLRINNKTVKVPVIVKIEEPDGWDISKLFNSESAKQGMACPELVIDARDIMEYIQKQEFKELIRNAVREAIPAELESTAGTGC